MFSFVLKRPMKDLIACVMKTAPPELLQARQGHGHNSRTIPDPVIRVPKWGGPCSPDFFFCGARAHVFFYLVNFYQYTLSQLENKRRGGGGRGGGGSEGMPPPKNVFNVTCTF